MHHLFLHVDVLKPEQDKSLYFLYGIYLDVLGIHLFSLRPKLYSIEFLKYNSTNCSLIDEELDERMIDAFHDFIEKKYMYENLFNILQTWLYVKEHRR
ncbi:hypothetical protein NC653_029013 [Populus alba x Populus x berolinensis]|uniref:Uncharacterized protein n=1 Tax=Populus alba x Populus x berolinensis TaxID=444605 RepID=A0AAD6M143_9ROSI|nr:hypothetical protein NC653_029013 [Populus alba x Populus x berolinensis]